MKIYYFFTVLLFFSCSNDMQEVNALVEKKELNIEIAKNVEIFYSDSSIVRMKIIAPTMHRHLSKSEAKEEWPDGIHVDFYNVNKKITAWLDAKYAVRIDKENRIIVRDSVVLHNLDGDVLRSPELQWDQRKELLTTEHFVQIIQKAKQDTIYGYGFETDKDFNKFRIKRKFSTKRHVPKFDF